MFTFSRLSTANTFIDNAVKIMMIVHGDDGYLWVVTPRDAESLAAQGYEVIR